MTTLLAGLSVSVPPAAAEADKATPTPWSVGYDTANASGTRWYENGYLTGQGNLQNTGSGCFTLWGFYTVDFSYYYVKHATQCGPGSAPVSIQQDASMLTSARLMICRGTEDVSDCGPKVRIDR
ncbi:hypothetical protein GCM10009678_54070 [Actinomadura kijaniata]|uniref:Uncharacterized protein n=1 Tax=Actinomadura namibiensis TaxID=182080 RepID=A0A7W3LRI5_ACTNM|nr:hypothetical protein [Actinomadura namibiensis]MBA8952955.1 hypothetical protein [Actinomadura namibiensis]